MRILHYLLETRSCDHTSHLFSNPFCKSRSRLERIGFIAFHILTLCIPLIVYHLIKYCSKTSLPSSRRVSMPGGDIRSDVIPNSPLSALGQEAIQHARTLLEKYRSENPDNQDINTFEFVARRSTGIRQPNNDEIRQLGYLYNCVYIGRLHDLLTKYPENDEWNQEDVLKTADDLIKISYAICVMMLDEVSDFADKQKLAGDESSDCSIERIVVAQNSYVYRAFFYLPCVYRECRHGLRWSNRDYEEPDFYLPAAPEIGKLISAPFYKDGVTVQSAWRLLHNEYCDRVRMYLSQKVTDTHDRRFFYWAQPDSSEKEYNFSVTPVPS